MSVLCLGVNHKTAPVEVRERLAFSEKDLAPALQEIHGLDSITETVVLSTCNRVEIYAEAGSPEEAFSSLTRYLASHFKLKSADEIDYYQLSGLPAAKHLFAVASGLDSMVLGETEIFGQVKQAYRRSHEAGTTAKVLNKLFQQSFQVGKLVRSSSHIGQGATSVGSVAVDLAEKIFGNLKGCQVMIIGAGEMSQLTAERLVERGASSIIVSNRSYDRAVELAEAMKGRAVHFDAWPGVVGSVDIIVSSTAAPHFVIHPEMIEQAMRKRRGRPLFLIDIAVPRDIDPAVNEIDSVYLYDIDVLEQIAEEGRKDRLKQIEACQEIIDRFVHERGVDALALSAPASDQTTPAGEGSSKPLTRT